MEKITNQQIIADLQSQFGETAIYGIGESHGILQVTVGTDTIVPLIHYLYQHSAFKFQFLTDLAGIHFPDAKGQELGVIYHLHSLENNVRIWIKAYAPIENPVFPTITGLYATANWMEREAFDFYGIIFEGHPNLKRILNMDEMDYFPMRKEYPVEDATRHDKIDELFGR
ncbi:NADH-quinone oxidoreductase subunit C [Sandaracinomonas limnophila]|uniref:NADH-quinone oxidoreductase subunit C n=1 Tax=Sandaracinomonas limnophila TaxID=1862386 RepID=A0A437PRM2_9BACT|nr:NADH-quinone oxidoreductase subunit C [Sandaracinomonas limnophila]RVU24891.1 NADH-quinone oxidoreductase subunit C [Sandaracinomonas limnophila]